ncbi:hypothetical protein [Nocardioides limicola]|uniref:hypothetical protein n=1 Tax=Nocardioides limicola TaxID=2803368 RepID=UPI00193BC264|nr:hypothetical protein [Nocardioides sp. DJM-14]
MSTCTVTATYKEEHHVYLTCEILWPSLRTMAKLSNTPVYVSERAAALLVALAGNDENLTDVRVESEVQR